MVFMEERVQISTPDHVELEFELAGPGSRFSAYLVDFLFSILLIVGVFVLVMTFGGFGLRALFNLFRGESGWAASWAAAVLIFIFFLINWGYYVFFEGLKQGSTPGKKWLGIRVIRQDGLPIGVREAALRNLVRAADMLPPPCYAIGGLVMYFDPQGRRLGDMVAGTYVVVERFDLGTQSVSGAAWAQRIEQGRSRQAVTLAKGSLSPHQIGLIEQYLARRHELADDRRQALAWQITEPLLSLVEEDRDQLARQPDRALRCEQILLQILEVAQNKGQRLAAIPKESRSPMLF